MKHVIEILELITSSFGQLASSEAVVGEPIQLGEVTLVPLSRISVSMGAGGGEGEGSHHFEKAKHKHQPGSGKGIGGGTGGGAKVQPVGVVVFSKQGVEVKLVKSSKGPLHRLLDRLPDLADRIKKNGPETK